jgi:hypothetical protein
MSPAMTITRKNTRKPLRQLDAAQLQAVTGGIIIYGFTSVGDGLTTTFTGGVAEALPAVQR